MIALGSLAIGCNSTIQLSMDDGGGTPEADAEAHDGKSSDVPLDAGSMLVFTYCSYTSDAGAPTCSGFAPWQTSPSETAQAQLNCMAEHGSVIGLCPTENLVGCCSIDLCPPAPPGEGSGCSYDGTDQPGVNVTCNYDEDAGATHVADLKCVAAGGTWTTTVPQ
jgi:hypothetical protein